MGILPNEHENEAQKMRRLAERRYSKIDQLREQLAAVTKERDVADEGRNYANELLSKQAEQLAARQAREEKLREALEYSLSKIEGGWSCDATDKIEEALAMPRDDSALRAAIAEELERMARDSSDNYRLTKRAKELRG